MRDWELLLRDGYRNRFRVFCVNRCVLALSRMCLQASPDNLPKMMTGASAKKMDTKTIGRTFCRRDWIKGDVSTIGFRKVNRSESSPSDVRNKNEEIGKIQNTMNTLKDRGHDSKWGECREQDVAKRYEWRLHAMRPLSVLVLPDAKIDCQGAGESILEAGGKVAPQDIPRLHG